MEPAVVVHNTSPPAAPPEGSRAGPTQPPMPRPPAPTYQTQPPQAAGPIVEQASVPPPAAAPLTPEPLPQRKPRLSNVALTFIAFYLVAAAVLLIVLVARHGSSTPSTVTASDLQKSPITIASVFVDGHEVCGALPCQLPDDSGSHWVSIRAAGYVAPDPVETTGDRPIHFTLRRTGATSAAPSAPAQAAATPAPSEAPKPTLSATPSAAPAETPSASAPAPVAHTRHRTYWHPPARLSFYSRPSALVLLDGRPLGKTPKFGVKVSGGRHSVLFVHGSRRIPRSVWAAHGQTRTVSVHF